MKKLRNYLLINRNLILYYIPFIYCFFTFVFLVLRFPLVSSEGVRKGYQLCVNVLIPSLYPFMVATEFLVASGLLFKSKKLFYFLSDKLFGLPLSFPTYIMSCLGGYPVGAECVTALFKNGIISREEGERMLLFSVNPSLNFVLSFVGVSLLRSSKAGIIIYISVIISSFLLGVCSSLFFRKSTADISYSFNNTETSFSASLTSSIKTAAVSMFFICAFTIFFSALSELCTTLPVSDEVRRFIVGLLEVTNGVEVCSNIYSIPFLAALISFGGLSTAFQVLTVTSDINIKAGKYIMMRFLLAFLSYFITSFLLKIFPVALETFSIGTADVSSISSHSVSVSAGLVVLSLILLGGDYLNQQKVLDS